METWPGVQDYGVQLQSCSAAMAADTQFECIGFFRYLYGEGLPGCHLHGALPKDAGCLGNFQCASGACHARSIGCGRCVDRIPVDAKCTEATYDPACVEGSTCGSYGDSVTTCHAYVEEGATCFHEACHWDQECRFNRCTARPKLGEDCSESPSCYPGEYCDPSTSRCAFAKPAGPGETCGSDDVFTSTVFHTCVHGYRCWSADRSAITGTCVPAVKRGEPCSADGGPEMPCESPLLCLAGVCGELDPASCP